MKFLIVVTCVLLGKQGIVVSSQSTPVRTGELTAAQAKTYARTFLTQVERPDVSEPRSFYLDTWLQERAWFISYENDVDVYVQARSGRGMHFVDNELLRLSEQPQFIPATRAITNKEALKNRVEQVISRLPQAEGVNIAKLVVKDRGDELNRFVKTTLSVTLNGRKVSFCGGEITTDTHSGKIAELAIWWYRRIESNVVELSEIDARNRAIAAYRAAVPDHLEATFPENAPGELVYAPPNGGFKGIRYPNEETKRVRLAYQFKVGDDYVWIDAANGNNIGGYGNLALRFETPRTPSP